MPRTEHHLPGPEPAPKATPFVETVVLGSLGISILSLLLFARLSREMQNGEIRHFDLAIRNWAHSLASPAMTSVMQALSFTGSWVLGVACAISLLVFLKLRWRRAATWLSVAMAGTLVLDLTLKFAFHRPRPVPFFGPAPSTWSFPSGHALFSFCFYGVMAGLIIDRTQSLAVRIAIGCAAVTLIAGIGFSRIYLGVHYPSDVLAGYLAAAVWVSAMAGLDRMRTARRSGKRAAAQSK
ncbi:MAG TPA: phosphatase PAP2 family protein [Candidatus Angelobacter sp.]|nr:phosphatase PAP2 family protein [Candidatus Angelobacter sp.]